MNVPMPLVSFESGGTAAFASVQVMWTVSEKLVTGLPLASRAVTPRAKDEPAVTADGAETPKCIATRGATRIVAIAGLPSPGALEKIAVVIFVRVWPGVRFELAEIGMVNVHEALGPSSTLVTTRAGRTGSL